ncbi:hypothetical protein [Dongia sp.]|uniref:hypothetical protein n=1 Tax=Dongia sp. TaxID=1977262 RepID=UPI003750FACC
MQRRGKSRGAAPTDAAAAALRAKARAAGSEALDGLLKLVRESKSEASKLAAIKELLDRGFGRTLQSEQAAGVVAHVLVEDGYEG